MSKNQISEDLKAVINAKGNFIAQALHGSNAHINVMIPKKPDYILQYPPRVEHFVGREKELKTILSNLQPGKVITLSGPGGIGKSALASKAIWEIAPNNIPYEKFPNGILWHDFYQIPNSIVVLEKIAMLFCENLQPSPLVAAQRALSGKQLLVLLDGTEEADDLPIVLSVLSSCCVIVTTRKKKDAVSERIDIQTLPQEESIYLFQAWSKVTDDIRSIQNICKLTGGLPLAIRLAGRYIYETGEPIKDYLKELLNSPIHTLDQGDRKLESVIVLLKHSMDQLSENALNILEAAAIISFSSFNKEIIEESILDIPINRFINELIGYGILNRENDRFIISHSLIHSYISNTIQTSNLTVERIANYFISYAKIKKKSENKKIEIYDHDKNHIMKVIKECKDRALWQTLANLTYAAEKYISLFSYYNDYIPFLKSGLDASEKIEDKLKTYFFLTHIGNAYKDLLDSEKALFYYEEAFTYLDFDDYIDSYKALNLAFNIGGAYFDLEKTEKALKISRFVLDKSKTIGDRDYEGRSLNSLGLIHLQLGQPTNALEKIKQALRIFIDIGDKIWESYCLNDIGLVYIELKQAKKAISSIGKAINIIDRIGKPIIKTKYLMNLGVAYIQIGENNNSIKYFERALKISREIGHLKFELQILLNLLSIYYPLETEKIIECCEQVLSVNRLIGENEHEGLLLIFLADNYNKIGMVDKAIIYYKEALDFIKKSQSNKYEIYLLECLGDALIKLGKCEKAINYYEQALSISIKKMDKQKELLFLKELGIAYKSLEQFDTALEYYEKALLISKDVNDKKSESTLWGNLGNIFVKIDMVKKAIFCFDKALTIKLDIGDKVGEALNYMNYGSAYRVIGNIKKAIFYYKKSVSIFRKIEDREMEGLCLFNLATAFRDLGKEKKAKNFYKEFKNISMEINSSKIKKFNWDLIEKIKPKNEAKVSETQLRKVKLLSSSYKSLGHTDKAINYNEEAIFICKEIGDKTEECILLGNLGNIYLALEQVEKAIVCYEEALVINRELERSEGECLNLCNIATAYYSFSIIDIKKGYAEKSINYYKKALEISRKIGHRQVEFSSLSGLSILLQQSGQIEEANKFFQESLQVSEGINALNNKNVSKWTNKNTQSELEINEKLLADKTEESAITLCDRGTVYNLLGNKKLAIKFYEKALSIVREIGVNRLEEPILFNIGLTYENTNQKKKALDNYYQALDISKNIKDKEGESKYLSMIGSVYYDLGYFEKAIEYYKQAFNIDKEIGFQAGESNHLMELGKIYYYIGKFEKSIYYNTNALTISKEIDNRLNICSILGIIGDSYRSLGDIEKSIKHYEQALILSNELENRDLEGKQLFNLALAKNRIGKYEDAINFLNQALVIKRKNLDRYEESLVLLNIGDSYKSLGKLNKSIYYYNHALKIFRNNGDKNNEATCLYNLANIKNSLKKYNEAIKIAKKGLQIANEIKDLSCKAFQLMEVGVAYKNLGNEKSAIDYLKESFSLFKEIKSPAAKNVEMELNKLGEQGTWEQETPLTY